MKNTNLDIINKFFEAYAKRDFNSLAEVLTEDVTWTFLGAHPLSGVRTGIHDVVAFFDKMGSIMGKSNIKVEKLVSGANDDYVVECQHISTDREDGNNIDHQLCVLWEFEDGKIKSGRHFFSDPQASDSFFSKVS